MSSSDKQKSEWKHVWTLPDYKSETWGLRRHNRTSGKSGWGNVLTGMGEYYAKTLCNDANAGCSSFQYQVVSPNGEVFELSHKDNPLRVEVRSGLLAIHIGVDTLAFADKERLGYDITEPNGFAKEVQAELEREREDGSTILTDLLDDAMQKAKDNGSQFMKLPEEKQGN